MSILNQTSAKVKSIPIQEHHMRLDILEKAVGFYFQAPNKTVKREILIMVATAMPGIKHSTANGVLIEMGEHSYHVSPERVSENGLCPYCQADLASTAKVVSAEMGFRETLLIWLCACGMYCSSRERGRY